MSKEAEVQETKGSEISLEEAKKRIAELESQLKPKQTPKTPEQLKKEKEEAEKQQQYFHELSRGAAFVKFVIDDLSRGKQYNRAFRRRIISQMMNKKFSKEFVLHYQTKIKQIEDYIAENMNKLTASEDIKKGEEVNIRNGKVNKVIDGPEFVKKLREEEAKKEKSKDEV